MGRLLKFGGLAVVMLLLLTQTRAYASSVNVGSFRISDTTNGGTATYTIDYAYQEEVVAGQDFNVTLTLVISNLTGLRVYVDNYSLYVNVLSPSGTFLGSGAAKADPPRYLYPGGHWGPVNVTVPIGTTESGARGTVLANVTIGVITSVWYDTPLSRDLPDVGSKSVGTVQVTGLTGQPQTLSPVLLGLAIAAAGAAFVAVAFRRAHAKRGDSKGAETSRPGYS
jgi:hypothetical protein